MKMNFIDKAVAYVSPQKGRERLLARYQMEVLAKAGYDAAGGGRNGMRSTGTGQNALNRMSLKYIRNNARELNRNNPIHETALQVVVTNTVGIGLTPSAKHTSVRKKRLADELMSEWANSIGCDFDGRLNLFGLQSLAMRTESLSGEALLKRQIVTDRNLAVPLRLKLLEPDFLDETRDDYLTASVIQGVQFDGMGQRTGYWLYDAHPGEYGGNTKSRLWDAEQIAHIYQMRRPGQVRGLPRGVASLMRMKNIDEFQHARLEQQKIAACLAAFIYSEEGQDAKGDPLPDRLFPGAIIRLKDGERVATNNPPATSGQQEFVNSEKRDIASDWGITYEALTGDYSGVNFASGKLARIQMFANIYTWRYHMLIPQMCKTTERWFVEAARLRGYDLSGVVYDWTPPKKEVLDVKAELPAIISEVRAGLNSWQSACRERGLDPRKLADELREDKELFDELGLVLDIDPRKITSAGQMQSVSLPPSKKDSAEDSDGADENEEEENAA